MMRLFVTWSRIIWRASSSSEIGLSFLAKSEWVSVVKNDDDGAASLRDAVRVAVRERRDRDIMMACVVLLFVGPSIHRWASFSRHRGSSSMGGDQLRVEV